MKRKNRRNGLGIYVVIIVIAIVGLIIFKNFPNWHTNWLETPASNDASSIIFEIEAGDSGKTVSENLKKEGLITNGWAFYYYLKNNDLGQSIPIGRFVLYPTMTPLGIIETITGDVGQVVFTIPEGYTIAQIDDKLYKEGLIEDDKFEYCAENCEFKREWGLMSGYSRLEGYLFPDTYFIDPNTFTPEKFIDRLLYTFEEKTLTAENITLIETSSRTLDEIVIAASIIEREVFLDEDMALVSGIIWKRYDSGWALGMCSTVNYITGKQEVTYEDTKIDSPYNTYQNAGFPPTAISNPGLSAIEAAINPQASEYWFFLNTLDTGETIYAVTNEEHNTNKAIYLN
ncbi:endolytic transglycosylase MltG [Candidatus Peregrinibacteria bacterium]|nr:endolytic transglycosylase MltG [Candidatus Peregrinibacteria bacterium]